MEYRLAIKSLATIEALEAYDYYEGKNSSGENFFTELDNCYSRILDQPLAFGYSNPPYREAKVNRFLYVVIYEVKEFDVIVYSVFNTYQDPSRKPSA